METIEEQSEHESDYQYDDELDLDKEVSVEEVNPEDIPLEDMEIVKIDEEKIIREKYDMIRNKAIFETFIPRENFYTTPNKQDFKAAIAKKKVLKKMRD